MLKIAMLGMWNHYHADEFLDTFLQRKEVMVAWAWDTDSNRGRTWADAKGIPYVDDLRKGLQKHKVDGVVLNAEPWNQAQIITAAMKEQVHILADKIVALGKDQIELLRESAVSYKGIFAVAYPLEGRAVFQTARKLIADGTLGRLVSLHLHQSHDGLQNKWLPEHFYKDVRGGVLLELGFPIFYLAPYLADEEVAEVTSMGSSLSGEAMEDTAAVLLRFCSGAIAVAQASYMSGISSFSLAIHGTDASFAVEENSKKLWLNTGGGWQEIEGEKALQSPQEDWLSAIQGHSIPRHGLEDGLKQAGWLTKVYKDLRKTKMILAEEGGYFD